MTLDTEELRRRIIERIRPQVLREANELGTALNATDDVLLPLLKFHLLAEQMLERVISDTVRRPDRLLEAARLTFAQKLLLVHALDVVDDAAIHALKMVNSLLNECAHVKDRQITQTDIDRIGQALGKEYRDLKRRHADDLRALLAFTLAEIAQSFMVALLSVEAEAHVAAEMEAMQGGQKLE